MTKNVKKVAFYLDSMSLPCYFVAIRRWWTGDSATWTRMF